jgi:hypothetical protein
MSPIGNRQASVGMSGAWLYAEVIESTLRSGEPIVLTRHTAGQ